MIKDSITFIYDSNYTLHVMGVLEEMKTHFWSEFPGVFVCMLLVYTLIDREGENYARF